MIIILKCHKNVFSKERRAASLRIILTQKSQLEINTFIAFNVHYEMNIRVEVCSYDYTIIVSG